MYLYKNFFFYHLVIWRYYAEVPCILDWILSNMYKYSDEFHIKGAIRHSKLTRNILPHITWSRNVEKNFERKYKHIRLSSKTIHS
jgi:hypothetical protein